MSYVSMGDFIPGQSLGPVSSLESLYGHRQFWGMGEDPAAQVSAAEAELAAVRAKRAEVQNRLQELANAGATVVKSVVGSPSKPAAAAGMGVGTMAALAVGGYFLAKQMRWI